MKKCVVACSSWTRFSCTTPSMGILWSGKKKKEEEEERDDVYLPDDLTRYLADKESQLSNREFKELIRRQSDNAASAEEDKSATSPDFLQMLQGKASGEATGEAIGGDAAVDGVLPPTPISTAVGMRAPRDYVDYEFDKFKRNNDEKESVLTNCSEIQNAFYECLGKQGVWDRLRAVSHLESDECTKLADFFMACTEVQKKAFLMFDYSTLDSIEEMKYASRRIDYVFNRFFQNIDDVQDRELFLKYTKEIRKEREEFFSKFGK